MPTQSDELAGGIPAENLMAFARLKSVALRLQEDKLVSLARMLLGNASAGPVVGIASLLGRVSVLLFLMNVMRNLRTSA